MALDMLSEVDGFKICVIEENFLEEEEQMFGNTEYRQNSLQYEEPQVQ